VLAWPVLGVFVCGVVLAGGVAAVRWLRVAQREHYIPGSTTRFAVRWWRSRPVDVALVVAALAAVGVSVAVPAAWPVAVVALVVAAVAPVGLPLKGRTSRLNWTRRMKLVGGVTAVLTLVVVAVAAAVLPAGVLALVPLAVPVLVDAALAVLRPVEDAAGRKFVERAEARLRQVGPRVVAITGSYGKTTTKEYVRHLLSTTHSVLASPASYNNRAGLTRTVNEHLVDGTEILVAEVGTYGPGEIRDICRWLRPEIGVITAIGPVHLERMRSLENITAAKAEILENVATAVLNVDYPQLDALADRVAPATHTVRCGGPGAGRDVVVEQEGDQLRVTVRGAPLATVERGGAHPGNVACAVAIAVELGVPQENIALQLKSLPGSAHRQQLTVTDSGVTIIDNTFNSNPDAARSSVAILARYADAGRRVVVSPGIVELGAEQARGNTAFAAAAADVATDFVIVGRTNRAALEKGLSGGSVRVHHVDTRTSAVEWVRATVGPGDAVLYENDLPDHYP
jgi:UDP-N-acetylmuramoyl-tripeptide--D-alanyl-D-alanine ligase